MFRRDRNRHGGGVAIYVRHVFRSTVHPVMSSVSTEFLLLRVSDKHQKFTAVSYRQESGRLHDSRSKKQLFSQPCTVTLGFEEVLVHS